MSAAITQACLIRKDSRAHQLALEADSDLLSDLEVHDWTEYFNNQIILHGGTPVVKVA